MNVKLQNYLNMINYEFISNYNIFKREIVKLRTVFHRLFRVIDSLNIIFYKQSEKEFSNHFNEVLHFHEFDILSILLISQRNKIQTLK